MTGEGPLVRSRFEIPLVSTRTKLSKPGSAPSLENMGTEPGSAFARAPGLRVSFGFPYCLCAYWL